MRDSQLFHNYCVHLCSEHFFNASIAFLDLENVGNDILHAIFSIILPFVDEILTFAAVMVAILDFCLYFRNCFVHLCSEHFFNAAIEFLDLENVGNDILHAIFCLMWMKF